MEREAKIVIRDGDAGTTVIDFLVRRFTYHTRDEWERCIADGRILLNQENPRSSALLHAGDCVRHLLPVYGEPPVATTYSVVAEDDAVLVIDKPAHLPCHPGGRYFNHTLWALLKQDGRLERPMFAHRLDRETSGLVVACKTASAARRLGHLFSSRQVEKRYTVFVEGIFPDHLEALGWLTRDVDSVIRKKRRFISGNAGESSPFPDAEWAETRFECVARSGGISQVRVYPKTGCLHQIRATLWSLGYPVVGDKLYGVDETFFLRFLDHSLTEADALKLRLTRHALHADILAFQHPVSGAPVRYAAQMPLEMAKLVL